MALNDRKQWSQIADYADKVDWFEFAGVRRALPLVFGK
jgi:hypothetical protein